MLSFITLMVYQNKISLIQIVYVYSYLISYPEIVIKIHFECCDVINRTMGV